LLVRAGGGANAQGTGLGWADWNGCWLARGYLVGEKRNVIIVHDVGAQEVSARGRFLACSVAQSEVNLDELAARKRYRCYCVLMSRMGPRPETAFWWMNKSQKDGCIL
jgi:hypothetical protein